MAGPGFPLSPAAVVVPTLACVTMVINIAPFIWHVKHRNLSAASLVFWLVLMLFFDFINALIWPTDDIANWFKGFVLCDIEVKLLLGATVGIPGSLASIMKNLAMVLDTDKPIISRTAAQRRRKLTIDILFSFGFPAYMMAMHYVVQPSRYYIYSIAGCVVSFDDSWPTVVLLWIWPSVLSLIGVIYSGEMNLNLWAAQCWYVVVLVVMRMRKYRKEFAEVLGSTGSNLTKSRFKRLFLMSATLIVIVLPVQFYVLAQNTSFQFIRYNWSAIHGKTWQDIVMVPTGGKVFYDRWVHIAIGLAMFLFFGLGAEALKMYHGWLMACGFHKVFPQLLRQTPTSRNTSTTSFARFLPDRACQFFAKKFPTSSSVGPLWVIILTLRWKWPDTDKGYPELLILAGESPYLRISSLPPPPIWKKPVFCHPLRTANKALASKHRLMITSNLMRRPPTQPPAKRNSPTFLASSPPSAPRLHLVRWLFARWKVRFE